MKRIIALMSLLLVFVTIQAQEDLTKYGIDKSSNPQGLALGSKLPKAQGLDVNNETILLTDYADAEYLIVEFVRGAWCPYCTKHLSNVADSLNFLTEKGATILVVTPDQTNPKDYKLEGVYPVRDIDNQIMKAFDVDFNVTAGYSKKLKTFKGFDLAEYNGQESAVLPIPGTFIFNKQQKLVARFVDPNYKERPPVQWMLNQMD